MRQVNAGIKHNTMQWMLTQLDCSESSRRFG